MLYIEYIHLEKKIFLWLTLQTRNRWIALAINITIQVLIWLAVHTQAILFALNIAKIIQLQIVWKMRLIYHLKHSLMGFRWLDFNSLGRIVWLFS